MHSKTLISNRCLQRK